MDSESTKQLRQSKRPSGPAPLQRTYASTKKIQTVTESLGDRVRQREWGTEEALPPQSHFSKEYGVSQGAISIAMRALQKQGLLHLVPGRGAFVAAHSETEQRGRIFPTVGLRGSYAASQKIRSSKPGSYSSQIMQAIWGAAYIDDCPLLLLPGKAKLTKQYCQAQAVQGVVFLGGESHPEAMELRLTGFPVIISNDPRGPSPISYIDHDHASTLREITRRFIEAGHRRIAVMFPSTSTPGSFDKLKPEFIDTLCRMGIQYNVDNYWAHVEERSSDTEDSYIQAVQKLEAMLDLPEPPTALFCLASGFYRHYIEQVLERRGLSVPRDFSLALAPLNDISGYRETTGFSLQFDLLAKELLNGIYESIKNPFYSVQKLIPVRFEDHGTIAPPPR